MLSYPWPGNIRQLKNITEQISIIETNREIDTKILERYLPDNHLRFPTVVSGNNSGKSFESEREILYSVLFDMRKEVAELKSMVHNLMAEKNNVTVVPQTVTPVTSSVPAIIQSMNADPIVEGELVDPEEYVTEEPLSLDEAEKELIRKALIKHHGKRKSAAQDLNISERTLYRKIKEYGLD